MWNTHFDIQIMIFLIKYIRSMNINLIYIPSKYLEYEICKMRSKLNTRIVYHTLCTNMVSIIEVFLFSAFFTESVQKLIFVSSYTSIWTRQNIMLNFLSSHSLISEKCIFFESVFSCFHNRLETWNYPYFMHKIIFI